jgi:hypothetical protein
VDRGGRPPARRSRPPGEGRSEQPIGGRVVIGQHPGVVDTHRPSRPMAERTTTPKAPQITVDQRARSAAGRCNRCHSRCLARPCAAPSAGTRAPVALVIHRAGKRPARERRYRVGMEAFIGCLTVPLWGATT